MCATLHDPEVFSGTTDADGQDDNEGTSVASRGSSSPSQIHADPSIPTRAVTQHHIAAGDEGDEDMDDAHDIDMTIDNADASPAAPGDAPQPPAFFTTLVAPLLKLAHPVPLSLPPLDGPSPHPPTTSALGAIHVGALECLNNIFLSMATSLAGRPSGLAPENGRTVFDAVWRALGAVGTDLSRPGQERRREMWNMGVGVLWGVGNVWKGALVPTEEHVQVLTQFCGATADSGVKVRTIGTLECLAQHPESVDANKVRTAALLCLQSRLSRPWISLALSTASVPSSIFWHGIWDHAANPRLLFRPRPFLRISYPSFHHQRARQRRRSRSCKRCPR